MTTNPLDGALPLPYLQADEILADPVRRAECQRLWAAGHQVYVREPQRTVFEATDGIVFVRTLPAEPGADYEIIDGGKNSQPKRL